MPTLMLEVNINVFGSSISTYLITSLVLMKSLSLEYLNKNVFQYICNYICLAFIYIYTYVDI